jgi:hypothetical protein
MVKKTTRGESKPSTWKLSDGKAKDMEPTSSLIFRGAELTLIEMLGRFPGFRHGEKLEVWEVAASRLVSVLIRIGFTNFVEGDFSRRLQNTCRHFVKSTGTGLKKYPRDVLVRYPVTSALIAMSQQNSEYWLYRYPAAFLDWSISSEPLEDLAHFPISNIYGSIIATPDPNRASAADLLSSVLASPSLITKGADIDAILLFAAARIVSFDGAPWLSHGRTIFALTDPPDRRAKARLARLTIEAEKWLSRELPRLNFSPSVEKLIEIPPSKSAGQETVASRASS